MIKCEDCQPLLYDYSKGKLSNKEYVLIKEHIAICNECKQALDDEIALAELMSDLPQEEPSSLVWNHIHTSISSIKPGIFARFKAIPQFRLIRNTAGFAATAAIALILILNLHSNKINNVSKDTVKTGYVVTAEWTDDPMRSSSDDLIQSIDNM